MTKAKEELCFWTVTLFILHAFIIRKTLECFTLDKVFKPSSFISPPILSFYISVTTSMLSFFNPVIQTLKETLNSRKHGIFVMIALITGNMICKVLKILTEFRAVSSKFLYDGPLSCDAGPTNSPVQETHESLVLSGSPTCLNCLFRGMLIHIIRF